MSAEGDPALPLLFSPLRVGRMTLRNRIVCTAHSTGLSDGNAIGDRVLAYYEARARGGVGLIITGSTSVHPSSTSKLMAALSNWDNSVIAPYRRLARAIHGHGACILAQLNHAGVLSAARGGVGRTVAPSAVDAELGPETPHALEPEEIAQLVAAFASAAVRARAGGLDGVELHGGHGNLIQQFLSPLTNRRDDGYGGALDNRMRFGVEVARAVRHAVGSDFTVGLRISAEEDHEGGLTLADTQRIVPALIAAGALDYVNVTSGSDTTSWSLPHHYAPMYLPHQHMRHLARGIRQVVAVPVVAVGRIVDPRDAEAVLAAGDADLVAMTRALIADRDLPDKARQGDFAGIRLCVGANDGCLGRLFRGLHITCIQDPTSGREHELGTVNRSERSGHLVVVGGGVAGLEAARVAVLRGYRVTLIERQQALGGQVRLARLAPGRGEIGIVADQLAGAAERAGVTIRLGSDATVDLIRSLAPDAVIVATGSEPRLPEITGAAGRLIAARAVLDGAEVGNSVIVLDTKGDLVGLTTADFLAERGKRVTVVTPARAAGAKVEAMTWRLLYQRLLDHKVGFEVEQKIARMGPGDIVIQHTITGREKVLRGVATIVAADGALSNDSLYRQLRAAFPDLPVRLVGDAVAPRQIEQAVYDGHMAARAL